MLYILIMHSNGASVWDPENFNAFTYSKVSHFGFFFREEVDPHYFGNLDNPTACSLKNYQDMLTLSFVRRNVPAGTRILEVGGGESRLIRHLKTEYDCWNLDKLAGNGQGPLEIRVDGFHLVRDYIGNFSPELPDNHFDFVFSISALEHIPNDDPGLYPRILEDINRVLKPGAYSLHCLDSIIKPDRLWTNALLPFLFAHARPLNQFVTYEELRSVGDVFSLPKCIYDQNWLPLTKTPYREFGRPISINILWSK